ncbi:RNA:RNP complex 1 interacting phosphatase [Fasciolopsis buskii]|uniref:RNA:RNP complex 1 interacting phosphatase n=1 Tax=Fasciolopsis buskii TaxID=27845 RepID=A0A8E0RSL9_9TREM|nr:RNA:RNP complex 1 interacting phosphatase [Fasciolopsis buski]
MLKPNSNHFSTFLFRVDGIIAVHCTHGVNRTGYLICRYIVEEMGRRPDEVLRDFEYARGHPVERASYIDSLMNLSPVRQKICSLSTM